MQGVHANCSKIVRMPKKVGIPEIARLAGVSIGTVDRALHGRKGINERTRKRILEVAKEHGYQPNFSARALAVGKAAIRIGVCLPREVHYFYDQMRAGIYSEARRNEHLGLEVIYRPTPRLGVGEAEAAQELLASGIHALAISIGDPEKLAPVILAAERHNVRVICLASDAPDSGRSTVICVNPEVSGRIAGELMSKMLPAASRVAVVTGLFATEDHRKKVQAFSETYERLSPDGRIVGVVEGHDDQDETFQKVYALLGHHKELRGIYVSTANCLPVCHAVGAKGLHSTVKLIASDLFQEMVPYLERGTILASIHQRPYFQGQVAVRLAVDHLINGHTIPPVYYLTPHIVLQSNLQQFREVREDAP